MRCGSVICLATLALGASGCEWLPAPLDPELVVLERTLKLEIVGADRVSRSGSLEVVLKLSQNGVHAAFACFGPSRGVSYATATSSGWSGSLMSHPGCVKEFSLHPFAAMTWREEIEIPGASHADVAVALEVEIVNPRTCGWFGCSAATLRSNWYSAPAAN